MILWLRPFLPKLACKFYNFDSLWLVRERRQPEKESIAGSLLLAHPSLRDPNFRRAVVLMSVHNSDGAMGVVLNRPLGKRLGELNGEFALGALAVWSES